MSTGGVEGAQECEERLRQEPSRGMMTGITLVPPENRLVETVRRAARVQAAAAGLPVGATWGGGDAAATPWPPVYAPHGAPLQLPSSPATSRPIKKNS